MTADSEKIDSARVRGPLPRAVPGTGLLYDLSTLGYLEEEFLLEGTAQAFTLSGERTADGRWQGRPDGTAAFVTRLLVRRPAAPERFSGAVVTEWMNVSGGLDAGPDWSVLHPFLLRHGHAWVGVSAQKVGIDGGGMVEGPHLKKLDPDRYGVLSHPGDAYSFDIFTQAGRAIASPNGDAPLGPLVPDLVLAVGESQSAAFLVTYINAVDHQAAFYDGFLVHGRGSSGAQMDGFRSMTVGADVDQARRQMLQHPESIRSDARKPVLVLQSETDVVLLGAGKADQPDSETIRLWEIAGAAHGDTYLLMAAAHDDGRLPPGRLAQLLHPTSEAIGLTMSSLINCGPQQHYVAQAAVAHLARWASGGSPPPVAERLVLNDDQTGLALDDLGNALGGVRTPWVDAPIAVLSGLGQTGEVFAMLFGRTEPFAPQVLERRYPGGRPEYVAAFARALDEAIIAGFLLEEDRKEILDLAGATSFVQVS